MNYSVNLGMKQKNSTTYTVLKNGKHFKNTHRITLYFELTNRSIIETSFDPINSDYWRLVHLPHVLSRGIALTLANYYANELRFTRMYGMACEVDFNKSEFI